MALQQLEPIAEAVYGDRLEDGRYHTRYFGVARYVILQVLEAGWAIKTERDGDLYTIRWWR